MPLKVEVMTLDLTSGFTGQSTYRVGAALPGPYVQATGTPRVDGELVEDVDVEVVEVPRLLPTRFRSSRRSLRARLTRLLLRQEASNLSCHLPPTSDPPQELELR